MGVRVVSGFRGLLGWLPGRRSAAQRRARARRAALSELGGLLAELDRDLKRLVELSQTTEHDRAAVIARETTATSRILAAIEQGDRLAGQLCDEKIASAWRQLVASTVKAGLLTQGWYSADRLRVADAQ